MNKQAVSLTPSEMAFYEFYDADSMDYRAVTWNSVTDAIDSKIGVGLPAFQTMRLAQVGLIQYEGFDPTLIVWTDFTDVPKQNKAKRKITAPMLYWLEVAKMTPMIEKFQTDYLAKYGKTIQEAEKTIKIKRK